jgi:hypothetical protein
VTLTIVSRTGRKILRIVLAVSLKGTKMPFPSYELHSVSPDHCRAAIAEAAYYKWLAAGQPQSRDLEFWAAAEQEVTSRPLARAPLAYSSMMPLWTDLQQEQEAHCAGIRQ